MNSMVPGVVAWGNFHYKQAYWAPHQGNICLEAAVAVIHGSLMLVMQIICNKMGG